MGERKGTKGLELWCRRMTEGYPGVKIDNMTTSWRDGLAFCAIIHHFRPDLIDFDKLDKKDVYHNNELAFRVAERHLGIPALLEPEDMVEYAVPDRLSILTYLSQFYKAFVVSQGSDTARIPPKRPTTTPDHGIVSPASTSPPTKVFVGAGRVRREPCAKCGLPVFIAERLNVGKLLYHRTCFRCARCNHQLTLANYYETENNQFCCETCPDEEKQVPPPPQQEPEKSVLSRSLSDEEKSASLKTPQETDDYSAEFETALENPADGSLKRNFTLTPEHSSVFSKARSKFINTQMEESNSSSSDSGNEDEPPILPKTDPPKIVSEFEVQGNSEDTLRDSSHSAQFDSGFPTNRLDSLTVNNDISNNSSISSNTQYKTAGSTADLEEIHNIVTKDKSVNDQDQEEKTTSVVKARMRLFESNKSTHDIVAKSDVNNKINIQDVPSQPALSESKQFHSNVPLDKDKFSHKDDILKQSTVRNLRLESVKSLDSPISVLDSSEEFYTVLEDVKFQTPSVITVSDASVVTISDTSLENSVILPEQETKTVQELSSPESIGDVPTTKTVLKEESKTEEDYPEELNPFGDDTVDERTAPVPSPRLRKKKINNNNKSTLADRGSKISLNPFDSEDEQEGENNKSSSPHHLSSASLNPFGSEDEDQPEDVVTSYSKPVAASRSKKDATHTSLNPFGSDEDDDDGLEIQKPTPSPRVVRKSMVVSSWDGSNENEGRKVPLPADRKKKVLEAPKVSLTPYWGDGQEQKASGNPFDSDEDEEVQTPLPANRSKKPLAAPKISLPPYWIEEKEEVRQPVPKPRTSRTSTGPPEPKPRESGLSSFNKSYFGSNSSLSSTCTTVSTTSRRKKPAPKPPSIVATEASESTPSSLTSSPSHSVQHSPRSTPKHRKNKKAPLPPGCSSTPLNLKPNNFVTSTIISPILTAPDRKDAHHDSQNSLNDDVEKEKIVKDELNRNRQSQNIPLSPSSSENSSSLAPPNKSTYGKWKRRKGQAPTRPIPQRRTIKSLPMCDIRKELEIIEIQQQGLEKQGVRLEQIIRDKCEGTGASNTDDSLPPEVEDLILQLFELVNEKNELFRKQAELMYLRRQQRLEEEHADVEYQIRCLMMQPDANKTDSDKAREEELINRLVDIVERRNEIIECLEMDRVREAEEDDSINIHMNMYPAKREDEHSLQESLKSKKDKKKSKKEKKSKSKNKIDVDKDVDETESSTSLSTTTKEKEKKKKKRFF